MAELWERQPGETAKAFAAFCTYRSIDPMRRSIPAAIRKQYEIGINEKINTGRESNWRMWCNKNKWVERASAWDDFKDVETRATEIIGMQEMKERQIRESQMVQSVAIRRLQTMQPSELTVREMLSFLIEASKLERLARGAETEHMDITSGGKSIKGMSDDELRDYVKDLLRKVDSGLNGSGTAQPQD